MHNDPLNITSTLKIESGSVKYVSLAKLTDKIGADVAGLPHTVKILLENIARRAGSREVSETDIEALASWPHGKDASLAFRLARVLMQDSTGVPVVVDLGAVLVIFALMGVMAIPTAM